MVVDDADEEDFAVFFLSDLTIAVLSDCFAGMMWIELEETSCISKSISSLVSKFVTTIVYPFRSSSIGQLL